ncbi:MAG: PLP-dependent aminotransferase family protein, partial [Pseudomonadota bacterium]
FEAVLPPMSFHRTPDQPGRSGAPMLNRQLYQQLRALLIGRHLTPGSKLPSSRALARDCGLSRNTVTLALEQLISEGYLQTRIGAGTFVADDMPDEAFTASQPSNTICETRLPTASARSGFDALSSRGQRLAQVRRPAAAQGAHSRKSSTQKPGSHGILRPSQPDIDGFPFDVWGRLVARSWRRPTSRNLLIHENASGFLPLRQAIADYLTTARAVRCVAEQVMIVSGVQQAMMLVANLLLEEGELAVIEEPGFPGLRGALMGAGARIGAQGTDREGLDPSCLPDQARLVCVAPSNHYPLGGTMSAARRLALLQWARERQVWIFEDDYDSEYRYIGRPLSSMQGMDSDGRVLYFGSFSKVMFATLRLGYLVVPDGLVDAFARARMMLDSYSSIVVQPALASFITEGYFPAHLRRTRRLYRERLAVMQAAVKAMIDPARARFSDPQAGMHACLRFDQADDPPDKDDRTIATVLHEQNVMAMPLSIFYSRIPQTQGLAMGFAGTRPEEIEAGIRSIAEIINNA